MRCSLKSPAHSHLISCVPRRIACSQARTFAGRSADFLLVTLELLYKTISLPALMQFGAFLARLMNAERPDAFEKARRWPLRNGLNAQQLALLVALVLSCLLLNARHFAEHDGVRSAAWLLRISDLRTVLKMHCDGRGLNMQQEETTTKRNPSLHNRSLEELMALANEIARYASTNDQGQFERARLWQ